MATNLRAALSEHDFENTCKEYDEIGEKLTEVQIDEKTGVIRYARAMKEHADNVWVWTPTEDQKRTGQFPINQIKGAE